MEVSMYAIVQTGGKQYKVEAGQKFKVEKLEKEVGDEFELTDVLLIGGDKVIVGVPRVEEASVKVKVAHQARANKIIVLKKKRRQGYRKLQGHRQSYTELLVQSILGPGGLKSVVKPEKKTKANATPKAKKATQEEAN